MATPILQRKNSSTKLQKYCGFGLGISGLAIFWSSIAFGIHHIIRNWFYDGIILTIALVVAAAGFVLIRVEKDGFLKAAFNSITLFLPFNILLFEIQLYFDPYPDPWWTRHATDWIAYIGLGKIITNEVVFIVCLCVLAARVSQIVLMRPTQADQK